MQRVIITAGAAGFIGARVCQMLLDEGYSVIGIDNLNAYYNPGLKRRRLQDLKKNPGFSFFPSDIENYDALRLIFQMFRPCAVINEAAQAGVRYSLQNPFIYFSSNTSGTLNLLDLCREYDVPKFVLASTSSLYAGQEMPFTEDMRVRPVSPYAASKLSAEGAAYTYHYLYGLDVAVLRYFTVYGPAGRPDMSYYRFISSVLQDKPLEINGDGKQKRDFTYVDDIAFGTVRALQPTGFQIINLGNGRPFSLWSLIRLIEEHTGKKARFEFKTFPRSDMPETWADVSKAKGLLNWNPRVNFEEGIKRTVEWSIENLELAL